ncbi:MAG: hypothetical protein ACRCT6_09325, partial [Notoacmeibacter sp.]
MTLIDVQSTRSQKSNDEPQGREKYDLKNTEAKSSTPYVLGVSVLALALYLKSFLVGPTKAAIPQPEKAPVEGGEEGLDPDAVGIEDHDAKPHSTLYPADQNQTSLHEMSAKIIPFPAIGSFNYVNPYNFDVIDYFEPEPFLYTAPEKPSNFSGAPLNDNRSSSSAPVKISLGTPQEENPEQDDDGPIGEDDEKETDDRDDETSTGSAN